MIHIFTKPVYVMFCIFSAFLTFIQYNRYMCTISHNVKMIYLTLKTMNNNMIAIGN